MKNEYSRIGYPNRYIGKRIRQCREVGMMSQRQLAEKAGMAQANIALIEKGLGNPTLNTLTKVAEGLSMELAIDLRRKLGR